MKFKDLKFAQKLGLGFGLLIIIAAILGLISVVNMQRISTKSEYLANEYVPEVKLANEIERYSLLTMYGNRGYGLTEIDRYLRDGQNNLQKVKNSITKAEDLVNNSQVLVMLENSIDETREELIIYENLLKETIDLNNSLSGLRDKMDNNAENFMTACFNYVSSQNNQLNKEIRQGAGASALQERHNKITWINNIIDQGNALRVANFKAQAQRSPEDYRQAINSFDISDDIESLQDVTKLTADKKALKNIEKSSENYTLAMINFIQSWEKREELNKKRDAAATVVLGKSQDVAQAGIENTQSIANEAVDLLQSSSLIMILGLIVAMIIGVLLAIAITRSITSGLLKGVRFAETVSKGDLTVELEHDYIERKDEIGILAKALNNMVKRLRDIVDSIIAGAGNIAAASQEMSSTSQQMSQGANEQASTAEEISSNIEEMVANIQQNTDNAQQTEKIALIATDGIKDSNNSAKTAITSMKNIADKIQIINEIAFQTNILALNAAVEAARAGEHGKGFAVVAAEVRKLAERSRVAADEIDKLTVNGVKVSELSGHKLQEIMPEIEKTAKLVQEITASSIEQNNGADQINNAVQQFNQVVQQNASSSEEMATSSEELAGQAEQLKATVQYFKTTQKHTHIEKIHFEDINKTKTSTPKTELKKPSEKYQMELSGNGDSKKDEEYDNF